ncbi:OmpA family protein [Metapseudomonas resinovorans]|uniref:OmpA-like domain-containing protein n=1 Tax=Metapseudomonas resinovorans NBRC 106553 TaxID=1245471 RepID=S6B9Z1_METRE|nr:OmpA family protein [Pseudomonas resinovorans]BAN45889.1 hypothetical protein PCA10_01570 [Pseudomonas resinovorans NBRC 106553]
MSVKLTRGLWLWAASLLLALTFAFPLSGWQRGSAALVIALVAVLAWRRAGRRAARLRRALSFGGEVSLPATGFQQPVVLVCGDSQQELFGALEADNPVLRTTAQGCYLRVGEIERLPHLVQSVLAHRPHWEGQLCVLLIVNPGEHRDAAQLHGQLRTFRHQLALARRHGAALPLLQATYVPSGLAEGPWFCWTAGARQPDVLDAGARASLCEWQEQADNLQASALRLRTGVLLESATAWVREQVQAHLVAREVRDPAAMAVACAIALVPEAPGGVAGNLWQQWLHDRTALGEGALPAAGASTRLPFPDPLLPLLPVTARDTPLRRAGVIALWLFAATLLAALASSAWQNRQLARLVGDDLRRYLAIPQTQHGGQAAEAALSVLRDDAARLDGYYRLGEPAWLGLGLYQGERLRRELLDAIASYRVPQAVAKRMPEVVRLDSLSLFAVGSASLKPESTKLLISALVDIKAQPGWLIVIAGHTDATGNVEQNLQLSRERAGAVRDWMQRMGDIPDSCFAVQGFGSSQPLASNDTEIGRAANRRVDIRLVPEVGACLLPTLAPDGQNQSHSAAVNL